MAWFLGLGSAGLVLLVLALIFDGVLDGLLDGAFGGAVSLPALAGFVSMLGFGGAITLGITGAGPVVATLAGTVAGVVTAWLVVRLSRFLMRDGAAPAPRSADLVGLAGPVVTPIPAGGYGEVMLRAGGQPRKYAARSEAPQPLGGEVWVTATLSATAVEVRAVER
ncbi:hypothetical protein [Streptomyces zingiberis]|uniref:NfeD-like C-terminal domain-containing protein n=1 Tax=Streptomyces zingiberis TaxID=2053010 RepID=A0ABX1BVP3_9ACTN|nr:hypothetical protein [Streptomyces zingiberis]NJP99318.1 hypothetical protein [Streptomyces zingiberis]